jgi:hypothetical protein
MKVTCRNLFITRVAFGRNKKLKYSIEALMKKNPLKQGDLTVHSAGIGTVTRKMVQKRAAELAVINGRSPSNILDSDWTQAKRELTGAPDIDPKQATLESTPESERWEPVPGTQGKKALPNPSEDEDDEGRSDNERLVEEGVADAEHDQMVQATRATKRRAFKKR